MAGTYNFDTATTLTITNNTEDVKAYDAGSLQFAKAADIHLDDNGVKYTFKKADRTIQIYKTNSYLTLKKGDSVKILASTAAELKYYESLADTGLTVIPDLYTVASV